jgi:hypothetical protein
MIVVSNIVLAVICKTTYVEKLKPEGKQCAHKPSSHFYNTSVLTFLIHELYPIKKGCSNTALNLCCQAVYNIMTASQAQYVIYCYLLKTANEFKSNSIIAYFSLNNLEMTLVIYYYAGPGGRAV